MFVLSESAFTTGKKAKPVGLPPRIMVLSAFVTRSLRSRVSILEAQRPRDASPAGPITFVIDSNCLLDTVASLRNAIGNARGS